MTQFPKAIVVTSLIAASLFAVAPSHSQRSMMEGFYEGQRMLTQEGQAEAKKVFEERLRQARRGDRQAQYEVGRTYSLPRGREVESDESIAFEWLMKSAIQGYAPAQQEVGRRLHEGRGVAANQGQAVYWYQKAADQGDQSAGLALAEMYEKGDGVAKDLSKAIQLLKRANSPIHLLKLYKTHYPNDGKNILHWMERAYYDRGFKNLRSELVQAYTDGKVAPPDYAKAFKVLNELYNDREADADEKWLLATLYEEGRGVNKNARQADAIFQELTNAGYPEAVLRAARLGAEGRDAQAQFNAATTYIRYKRNALSAAEIDQVIQWLEQAATKNHQDAKLALAEFYSTDLAGHRRSEEKSLAILEEMAGGGEIAIQVHLFNHYSNINDEAKALHWLQAAATQGLPDAQFAMGRAYFGGLMGLTEDHAKAVEWYRASAEQGHPLGMYETAHMFEHGHGGVETSSARAQEWYEKSAEAGVPEAMEKLRELK